MASGLCVISLAARVNANSLPVELRVYPCSVNVGAVRNVMGSSTHTVGINIKGYRVHASYMIPASSFTLLQTSSPPSVRIVPIQVQPSSVSSRPYWRWWYHVGGALWLLLSILFVMWI